VLKSRYNLLQSSDRKKYIKDLEKEMLEHAKNLEFEQAAILRDEIEAVKAMKISR
jgi:excinuclease ABC subunit B